MKKRFRTLFDYCMVGRRRICLSVVFVLVVGGVVFSCSAEFRDKLKSKMVGLTGMGSGSEEGCIFFAEDVLSLPGKAAEMSARVKKVTSVRKKIEGLTIGFFHKGKRVGTAITGPKGWASCTWRPPGVGMYELQARIERVSREKDYELLEMKPTFFLVCVRKKNAPFVVVDLDYTVADGNIAMVIINKVKPMAGSPTVLKQIARKYTIIYVTHRPHDLTRASRKWLAKHKYPAGPLFFATSLQTLKSSHKFKASRLATLKETFSNVEFGVGDRLTDAQAYRDNGMRAVWIPKYSRSSKRSMTKLLEELSNIKDDRISIADNWTDISESVLKGNHVTADQFAERLRKRIKALD